MRLRFPALLALLVAAPALVAAQGRPTIPPAGAAATLDVGTWNTEWFGLSGSGRGPTDEARQFRNVLEVLRQSDVDVWGLQELAEPTAAQRLFDSLAVSGLAGVLGPSVSTDPLFDQRLGFVYDPAVITNVQVGTILANAATYFGGRAPLQLQATVALGDTALRVRFIDIHAKASRTVADYTDRLEGATRLKNYIDNVLLSEPQAHVVLLGDFNDELLVSTVGGRPSPYQTFRDDPADYLMTTLPLDQANVATFCSGQPTCSGSGTSTYDHLIATTTLADEFEGAARYGALLDAFDAYGGEYVWTTSDHLPVVARFAVGRSTPNEAPATRAAFALEAPYPNPFRSTATLAFGLDRPGAARLEVFDALGRRVATLLDEARPAGRHEVRLDGARLRPGLYLVRLAANGQTATRRLVKVD